jgi:hypothetical protein
MTIQPERAIELTKLTNQPEVIHEINDLAQRIRPQYIQNTGRILLGQDPLVGIHELQQGTQEELLFVMRALRDHSIKNGHCNE